MTRVTHVLASIGLGAALVSCTGHVFEERAPVPGTSPSDTSSPGSWRPAGSGGTTNLPPSKIAPIVMRRLTSDEYARSIRDLLGIDTEVDFSGETVGEHGFRTSVIASTVEVQELLDVADAAAQAWTDRVSPCDGADDSCAREQIATLARRAYRRPPNSEELRRLEAFYSTVRSDIGHDVPNALRLVVSRILQSPQFAYLAYRGLDPDSTGARPLSAYERASRLSYFLWRSLPDDVLLGAAESGDLMDPSLVAAQVERMLDDPRAEGTVAVFIEDWLELRELGGLERDENIYPENSRSLQLDMKAEATRFASEVILRENGLLATLLAADFTYANEAVANLYGVGGVSSDQFERVSLAGRPRAGILTQPAFLAVTSTPGDGNPIQRGVALYRRVLCFELPDPPADTTFDPDEVPTTTNTIRDAFPQHLIPRCAACHVPINRLGFGFDRFDALGRYNEEVDGQTIDASGEVQLDGAVRPFENGNDFARIIADSSDARHCTVENWARYALGRTETPGDFAALQALADRFDASEGNVRDLIAAIATSQFFLYRAEVE